MKKTLLYLCALASVPALYAGNARLAENGQARAEIIVAKDAAASVKFAAEDLALHLGKISGGKFAVVNAPSGAPRRIELVVTGTPEGAAVLKEEPSLAKDYKALADSDGYAVRMRGSRILMIADNGKGMLNGVHRWMEKNTDIIWPRPAGNLAIYSERPDLVFQKNDYIDMPKFRLRYFGQRFGDPEVAGYLIRNASSLKGDLRRTKTPGQIAQGEKYGSIHTFFDSYGNAHNMVSFWFPPSRYFKEHPDYYMLLDGRRYKGNDGNLCETNPEMAEAYCAAVEERLKTIPGSCRVIHILMEDTNLTCSCGKCLAPITLPDGRVVDKSDPAFRSTRFFLFFNKVARHVKKLRPGMIIRQFAYVHLAVPPKIKVEDNIQLVWCPYPRNMKESVVEGPSNRGWRKKLDGWLDITPNLYFREYYFCGCIYYPRPMADTAAVDLRYILKKGVKDVYCDSAGNMDSPGRFNKAYKLVQPYSEFWDLCGVEAWTVIRLFWDPAQDPRKLREEFLRRTFREAAPDMIRFYNLLRDSWYGDNMASGWSDNAFVSAAYYIVGKKIDAKCRAALESAEKNARHPESLKWIRSIRRVFEHWCREAPNHAKLGETIPLVPCEGFPGFDFSKGAWQKAVRFPVFKTMGTKGVNSTEGLDFRMFSDGRAFYIGARVAKDPKTLYARETHGAFPAGDMLELFFSHPRDAYYQFAFDKDGRRYEAQALNSKWDCGWDLRTVTEADGWAAVARIPFDSIGFKPIVNNKLRFLPLVNYYRGGRGKNRLYSWQGGLSHAPATWGELTVNIE